MPVAVFITNEKDASSMIPWGVRFAAADHRDLLVIVPRKSKGKRSSKDVFRNQDAENDNALRRSVFAAIDAMAADSVVLATPPRSKQATDDAGPSELPGKNESVAGDEEPRDTDDRVEIHIREIIAANPESAIVDEVDDLHISMLLLPADEPTKAQNGNKTWITRLLNTAHCETMILRGPCPPANKKLRVLVATRGEPDTEIALHRAVPLVAASGGDVSLLFVRPDDDEVAEQVARLHLDRLSRNTCLSIDDLPKSVVLSDNFREAIQQYCHSQDEPLDIVLVGTRNHKTIKQLLRPFESADQQACAIATIREGVPLTTQLWNRVESWVRKHVPQLDRDRRVRLVDQLVTSSAFNFDFIALTSLSTLIAALGLIRNSASVVIGAMLIAPLMTPLAGTGFALVQGNEKLIRGATKSVIYGFAVAFLIALATGILVPGIEIQSEMASRGSPNLLDLLVALVSGIAAAYAMGRPNLLSALPGVAIAAALVPPIATSGIALACGDFGLSAGALLLFLTNIFAIILGTTISYWAVGIDSRSETKKREGRSGPVWPRIWFLAFVAISVILAAIMTIRNGLHPR